MSAEQSSAAARDGDPVLAARRTILILLTLLSAFNHLDRQLVAIVLEPIREEFRLTDLQLGLLSGLAFAALYTTLSIPAALWAVRHSRVRLVTAAALVWGAMTAAAGFVQNFAQLLLTRIGVGIGEAGYLPAAHGIISSLYRPGERATALAILSAGVNGGIFLAFLFGGVVSQFYGWRMAFVLSGLATVLLAILFGLLASEPSRTPSPHDLAPVPPPEASAFWATLGVMVRDPVLRNVTIAAMLTSTVVYGALSWLPSYLIRSHGFSLTAAGVYLALIIGIGGAIGTWLGGHFSDRLGRIDLRWSLWFVAAAYLFTKPLAIGFFLVDNAALALILFVLPAMTGAMFVGPSVATLHARIFTDHRPVASALFLFLTSFIGIGLSPVLTGGLSQFVFAGAGEDSLRYALVATQILGLWGVWHFFRAGSALVLRPAPA
jgi:predicted MFS family arabinose efflux permease